MNKDGEHLPPQPHIHPPHLILFLFLQLSDILKEFFQMICEFGWLETIAILRLRRELMFKYFLMVGQKTF